MRQLYEVIKVMNNNVLLAINQTHKNETVLIGKGLGFSKKRGQIVHIPAEKIEKAFYAYEKKLKDDYIRYLSEIDSKVLATCAELITLAEKELGNLSHKLLLVLTDHVSFAIERLRMGMEISNPFIYEIKNLYPQEYALAEIGRQLFEKNLKLDITSSEVGFIAWHLNAAKQRKAVTENVKITRLIKELMEMIEREIEYTFDVKSMAYNRLINHLKGLIYRSSKEEKLINPLKGVVKMQLHHAYRVAMMLKEHIEQGLGIMISEDELAYLAIHIDRLRMLKETVF